MGNLNNDAIQGFASLMYYILIHEGKHKIADIAKGMRITDDTLYRYCRGEKIPPPGRVIDLINVTKEIRFLRFFCEPCGYLPINKVESKDLVESIKQKEIRVIIYSGKAIEKIEKAFEDNKITKKYNQFAYQLNNLRELCRNEVKKLIHENTKY